MAIEYEATITVQDLAAKRCSLSVRRFDLGAVPPIDETYNILDAIIDTGPQKAALLQDFKDQIEARVISDAAKAAVESLEATLISSLTTWEGTR